MSTVAVATALGPPFLLTVCPVETLAVDVPAESVSVTVTWWVPADV